MPCRAGLLLFWIALGAGAGRLAAQDRRLMERVDPVTATTVQGMVVLFAQLAQAREALGRQASEAELTAAVGALRAGLAPADLSRLHQLRAGRSLVVPIAVLTDRVA